MLLPGTINGLDFIRKIKSKSTLKKTPIIVVSNLESQREELRQAGAVDYYVKTTTSLEELVEKVKKLTQAKANASVCH